MADDERSRHPTLLIYVRVGFGKSDRGMLLMAALRTFYLVCEQKQQLASRSQLP
ncbi:MAG: hypothetical protein HC941_07005 [Microcoleus sp. SU_5_3]|nr:hypothetical protein [Microcoleus sp. SU_5_3]